MKSLALSGLFLLYFFLFIIPIPAKGQENEQLLLPVLVEQKWGFIDTAGEVVIPPKFSSAELFKGEYTIAREDKKAGMINRKGDWILPPRFENLRHLTDSIFAYKSEKKWGLFHMQHDTLSKPEYDDIEVLEGKFFLSRNGEQVGLLSRSGEEWLSPCFEQAQLLTTSLAILWEERQATICDSAGRTLYCDTLNTVEMALNDSVMLIKKGDFWGGLDLQGDTLIPLRFTAWMKVGDEHIQVKDSLNWALCRLRDGQLLTTETYEGFRADNAGNFYPRSNGLEGLMNKNGELLLPMVYNNIHRLSDGNYYLWRAGLIGLASAEGKELIAPAYQYVSVFDKGIALVNLHGRWGVINNRGQELVKVIYQKIIFEKGIAKAYLDDESVDIFEFDDQGNLKEESQFVNVVSISLSGSGGPVGNSTLGGTQNVSVRDIQVDQSTWFFDPEIKRWGLRNNETGVEVIPPKYTDVYIQPTTNLTLTRIPDKRGRDKTTGSALYLYGLVDHITGVIITEPRYTKIFVKDFEATNNLSARVINQENQFQMMQRDGFTMPFTATFIGEFHNGLARVNRSGKWQKSKAHPEYTIYNYVAYIQHRNSPYPIPKLGYSPLVDQLICRGGMWNYVDERGKLSSNDKYSFIDEFQNGTAKVRIGDPPGARYGVMKDGRVIISTVFSDVDFLPGTDQKIFRLGVNYNLMGKMDREGRFKIDLQYDRLKPTSFGLTPAMEKNKWGYLNDTGKVVLPFSYDAARSFSDELAAVSLRRKWNYIATDGEKAIDGNFNKAGNFQNGITWVKKGGRHYYIDKLGNPIHKMRFQNATDYQFNRLARVQKGGKWGIIDLAGEWILKPKYSKFEPFNQYGLALVNKKGKWGMIDTTGQKVLPFKFQKVYDFNEGYAKTRKDGLVVFIDSTGSVTLNSEYRRTGKVSEGLIRFKQKGRWGYMTVDGTVVIEAQFRFASDFSNGRAVVGNKKKLYGAINRSGRLVIPYQYMKLTDFSEGSAVAYTNEHVCRYINLYGKTKFPRTYQGAKPFKNGFAETRIDGKWGMIDENGDPVIPNLYGRFIRQEDGSILVTCSRFYGISTLSGRPLIKADYQNITYVGDNIFQVMDSQKIGYLNLSGQWIWAPRR